MHGGGYGGGGGIGGWRGNRLGCRWHGCRPWYPRSRLRRPCWGGWEGVGGGANAPCTSRAALAQVYSDDMPPWPSTVVLIAGTSSGRAVVVTAPTRAVRRVPRHGLLQGRADVEQDVGRERDGGGYRGEGQGFLGGTPRTAIAARSTAGESHPLG